MWILNSGFLVQKLQKIGPVLISESSAFKLDLVSKMFSEIESGLDKQGNGIQNCAGLIFIFISEFPKKKCVLSSFKFSKTV